MATRTDRAIGAIVGLACGDALGAPYEFGPGQGAGDADFHAPRGWGEAGTWTDDTAMAVAVLLGALELPELETPIGQDAVARTFLRWATEDGRGIGNLTFNVLLAAQKLAKERHLDAPGSAEFRASAAEFHRRSPDAAGNGALMRSAAVAVGCLHDRTLLAARGRAIAELTHMHPLAGDSCVLWNEAIRVAAVEERIDLYAGVDLLPTERHEQWRAWLSEAVSRPPSTFTPNGWTVSALQAAASVIAHSPEEEGQFQRGLHAAVRIGNDTDTVAAITGALLGARWGVGRIPKDWIELIHGWPSMGGEGLAALATSVAGSPRGR
ncbi:ADP-ribosylglycohydrolase family protein [Nocardioides cavernaquae]|uniref:ADP-ribosylglycohydrolase family protein n=1 Tax=Nocardioides cavernaquae TaxID=2321396 RepID=A0A3A5HHR4_9ACTN|nr:ADP-ribosylglycohydrolase family protein [Nocardioides cavernaquae]RJS47420.1 ADP-ribosylglycohydrolase family protein [Nocardioides cavernaquae]